MPTPEAIEQYSDVLDLCREMSQQLKDALKKRGGDITNPAVVRARKQYEKILEEYEAAASNLDADPDGPTPQIGGAHA